jgi:hypothetical protein
MVRRFVHFEYFALQSNVTVKTVLPTQILKKSSYCMVISRLSFTPPHVKIVFPS